jgi:hypothetical protein
VSKINTPRQRLLRINCPSPGIISEADIPKAGLVEGVGIFFEVAMKVFCDVGENSIRKQKRSWFR